MRRSSHILFVGLFLCALAHGFSTFTYCSVTPRKILIFSSEESHRPADIIVDRAIREAFSSDPANPVTFYNENQDSARIPNDTYEDEYVKFLRRKYSNENIALIFVRASPGIKFLLKHEAEIFTGVPKIFITNEQRELAGLDLANNFTGVFGKIEFGPTLELILQQRVTTKKVVVVTGLAIQDKDYLEQAKKDFERFAGRVEIDYLSGLTLTDLQKQLSSLPPDNVCLFISYGRDPDGNGYSIPDVMFIVGPSTSVPIYAVADTAMGTGVVGGEMFSYELMSRRAADIGLRILSGQKPSGIPPQVVNSTPMFDWRQLRRWNINETALPVGSVIRFKEPTAWEQYKWQIVGTLMFSTVETLLIGWLLFIRARRKKAEEDLRDRELDLAEAQRIAQIGSWEWDPVTDTSKWSEELYHIAGLDPSLAAVSFELSPTLFTPESHKRLASAVAVALESGIPYELELEMIRGDKQHVWVSALGEVIRDDNHKVIKLRGTVQDISDQKKAACELTKALDEVTQLQSQLQEENIYLREEIKLQYNFDEIVGHSEALKYVLYKIEQVAPADATVLISGETGTGKELVARAIHSSSPRKARPLVKVNCAALSASLIESELFGHERGSFTGASARKIGRFELADGATIFLDEIGELPLELQVKLLRVIQEGELERLGSSKTIKVDARIIAATNRDLESEVRKGNFREDLLFRLNVFPITVPPLRERLDDIPELVEHFTNRFSKKLGKNIRSVSPPTIRKLSGYWWPGNIRELANVIERSVIYSQGEILQISEILDATKMDSGSAPSAETLETMERKYIMQILDDCGWKIEGLNGAAGILGLNPGTLRSRMSKLGIVKHKSKMTDGKVSL